MRGSKIHPQLGVQKCRVQKLRFQKCRVQKSGVQKFLFHLEFKYLGSKLRVQISWVQIFTSHIPKQQFQYSFGQKSGLLLKYNPATLHLHSGYYSALYWPRLNSPGKAKLSTWPQVAVTSLWKQLYYSEKYLPKKLHPVCIFCWRVYCISVYAR